MNQNSLICSKMDSSKIANRKKLDPVYVIFISLLLDLLAFTMILPLLPSLLDHYKLNDSTGLYAWLSVKVKYFQEIVGAPEKFNNVLFGGFLGSMYSFLQYLSSPLLGSISDVVGRRSVMITCLVGISFSYILWAFSSNLILFIIARFIGGISKGNVSLSMAIITDVSSVENRGKGMALVGIAFSLGFIVGPLIGAAFAVWAKSRTGQWYIIPAIFALILSLADLLFVSIVFRESLPKEKRAKSFGSSIKNAEAMINIKNLFSFSAVIHDKNSNSEELRKLGMIYFVYLFIYSGLEFTLTFLTHHVFNYTSMQQGWMFFSIGLTMAVIQGGYVRKIPKEKIKQTAILGLWLIIPSFICVGLATGPILLYSGLFLYATSTALVVPCIMTMASLYGSADQKGTVMGIFRSLGALARAVGPIIASITFWSIGSCTTYLIGSICLLWPVLNLKKL